MVELNENGDLISTNIYAPDGLVAKRMADGTTGSYLFDLQGNTAEIITGSGVKVNAAYNAWGQCNYMNPVPFPNDPFMQHAYNARWGYLGDETGLYYCQNRYYDPGTGRFLTRDPISYSGGMNLYGYCGGGPVGAADPEGLTNPGEAAGYAGALAEPGSAAAEGADLALEALEGVGEAADTATGIPIGDPWVVPMPYVGPSDPAIPMDRCDPKEREFEDLTFYRYGYEDSETEIYAQVARAATDPGFGPGLSVNSRPHSSGAYRAANAVQIYQAGFLIKKTGKSPFHYTIPFSNPPTSDEISRWSKLFPPLSLR